MSQARVDTLYLYGTATSFEIMSVLKLRYMVFSWAAQLNLWAKFVNTVCNKGTPATGVANCWNSGNLCPFFFLLIFVVHSLIITLDHNWPQIV
jgi:Na+/proline symporter